MSLIIWNDSLITGIYMIDAQHKILINKVNKLQSCIQNENSFDNLSILLDELLEYTIYHFEMEEELFNNSKYSEKDSHLKKHAAFSNYIKGFLDVKNRDNILEAKNLLKYLNNWIVYHIKEVDMKYVPFLKEKMENN